MFVNSLCRNSFVPPLARRYKDVSACGCNSYAGGITGRFFLQRQLFPIPRSRQASLGSVIWRVRIPLVVSVSRHPADADRLLAACSRLFSTAASQPGTAKPLLPQAVRMCQSDPNYCAGATIAIDWHHCQNLLFWICLNSLGQRSRE